MAKETTITKYTGEHIFIYFSLLKSPPQVHLSNTNDDSIPL